MIRNLILTTLIASSFVGVGQAQGTQQQNQLPTLPIVDARSGRLTNAQVNQGAAHTSPIQSTNAQTAPADLENIMSQVKSRTPQLVGQSIQNKNSGSYIYRKAIDNYKPTQHYDLNPTDSIIIPVGQGVMNSIITNYDMVAVKTSDKTGLYEPESGYLYATIKTNDRVGLILFEEGVPESQVAVTLVPIDAPPAVINLNVAMSESMNAKSREFQKQIDEQEAAHMAREEQTYYSSERGKRVVQLLTPVAQGDLPPGFSLSSDIPADYKRPCAIPIYHQAGQRLMGGREVIDVVLVKNTSNNVFQMREEMCAADDVIAVGLYKKSYLQPGEEMELYILRDKFYKREKQRQQRRPRLTVGG